jgi:hypothetical protein
MMDVSMETKLHFRKDGTVNEVSVGELVNMLDLEFDRGFYSRRASKFLQETIGRGPMEFYYQPNLCYRAMCSAGFISGEHIAAGKQQRIHYRINRKPEDGV